LIELDFKQLVTQNKAQVYNTCLGFVKVPADAEDLTQEVFITAYNNWRKYRWEANIKTWLYRISVNKSLDFIRANQRLKRSGMLTSYEEGLTVIDFKHPGIELENKEKANLLMTTIAMLPEKQKVAFTLQKIEGLTVIEISQIMELSKSAIESLLHRAKYYLQTKLRTYYENK
jgi:RNA polymerase sigma factor (sigma-70 family)